MSKRSEIIRTSIISVIVGLVVGAIIIALLGKNPLSAYFNLLQGCGLAPKARYAAGSGMATDLLDYIDYLTPMVFAALGVAVALKAGLFNIGISGQMLFAGFLASATVGYSALAAPVAKVLVIAIGIVAGALLGGLVGWLKYRFNINEVVSTIMFNYIVSYVVSFIIQTKYIDPISRQSKNIGANARLTLQDINIGGYIFNIPLGFILAIICVIVVAFLMDHTVLGFELKSVGTNKTAARYAGMNVGRSLTLSMMISGALAGLAGVTYYLGYFASIQPRVLASTGYDAIAVCLVGSSNPVGIFIATLLLQIIPKGATYMSSTAGLESEIASVITAVILLSTTVSVLYAHFFKKKKKTAEEGGRA